MAWLCCLENILSSSSAHNHAQPYFVRKSDSDDFSSERGDSSASFFTGMLKLYQMKTVSGQQKQQELFLYNTNYLTKFPIIVSI